MTKENMKENKGKGKKKRKEKEKERKKSEEGKKTKQKLIQNNILEHETKRPNKAENRNYNDEIHEKENNLPQDRLQ